MIRVWAHTEKCDSIPFNGMRLFKSYEREIWRYHFQKPGVFAAEILYSNKTCMRYIEVCIIDEGEIKII